VPVPVLFLAALDPALFFFGSATLAALPRAVGAFLEPVAPALDPAFRPLDGARESDLPLERLRGRPRGALREADFAVVFFIALVKYIPSSRFHSRRTRQVLYSTLPVQYPESTQAVLYSTRQVQARIAARIPFLWFFIFMEKRTGTTRPPAEPRWLYTPLACPT